MTRLFNGDHHESCVDAATCFVLLSNNLNKDTNFDDAEIAVESVIAESLNVFIFFFDINIHTTVLF